MEGNLNGERFALQQRASSDVLDLAVLDSGQSRDTALPFRQGNALVLGESITAVGFPLRGILGDSANVTRGNVSASTGIRGSMGMFQYSAPAQPGNSGGPIVSDLGQILGVAVSTLNTEALSRRQLIPQNVNFALEARHVIRFLERESVPYESVADAGEPSMQRANQAALAQTVQLNCYQ